MDAKRRCLTLPKTCLVVPIVNVTDSVFVPKVLLKTKGSFLQNCVMTPSLNSIGTDQPPRPPRPVAIGCIRPPPRPPRPVAIGHLHNVVSVNPTFEPRARVPEPSPHIRVLTAPGAAPPQNGVESALSPLTLHLQSWSEIGASPWVLRTISKGYKLQFARRPPACGKPLFSQASGQAAQVLQDEIASLLDRRAIRVVPPQQSNSGFFSRYFLVKKKGGGVRPILDLRALNGFLKTFRFKMLTNKALLRSLRRGDWYTTLDLRDAYFHIPIYPPHRKFLRFGFKGQVYEYLVLPFGLSLSPRTFVKCTQAAVAPLRQQGIWIAMYIDDWLICADSEVTSRLHTQAVVDRLTSLGFTINYPKSHLTPTQSVDYIGLTLNASSFVAKLSQERAESLRACVAMFRPGCKLPFRTCQRMAGLMASAISVIRLGRLFMRPFQKWMRSLGLKRPHHLVDVSKTCVEALRPWTSAHFLSEGVTMGMVTARKVITTDASLSGWGATHEGRAARGVWNDDLKSAHINYLELLAIRLALQHFLPLIQGCHVLVRTDNTTALCYVNKQGGVRSAKLHALAHRLTLWCDEHLLSVRAVHVPGLQNTGADLLSRGQYRYADWSLNQHVANLLWRRFGRPKVDLFASEENSKCPLFFSMAGSAPLGLDALAHSWPQGLLYAFPPLSLILPTLERVRTHRLSLILVAPAWGAWRSEIVPLLYDSPWQLPLHRDLLSQARGEIFHPRPMDLDLWAWPVRG